MMKKFLISNLITVVSSLATTSALAHTGHMTNESIHSFLHVEHIVAITAIALIAYFVNVMRNK